MLTSGSRVHARSRLDNEMSAFELFDAADVREPGSVLDDILTYFEERAGGKRLPNRADVNPVQLKPHLSNVCLLTPVYRADGSLKDVIVDLMGTRVASFYGEITGKSIFVMPLSEVSDRIFASASDAISNRRPTLALAQSMSSEQQYLRVEALYIPMSEDGEKIDRLFLYVAVGGKSNPKG